MVPGRHTGRDTYHHGTREAIPRVYIMVYIHQGGYTQGVHRSVYTPREAIPRMYIGCIYPREAIPRVNIWCIYPREAIPRV